MSNLDELKENADARARAQIREAFALFDKDKRGVIIQEEVPNAMRYLGVYVSDKDVVEKVLPEMQEDEPTEFVTYEKFEKKLLSLLDTQEYAPDTEDELLRAFGALDKEKRGFVEADKLRELLLTHGTPFRDKEVEDFMAFAKDIETGNVYYEEWVSTVGR